MLLVETTPVKIHFLDDAGDFKVTPLFPLMPTCLDAAFEVFGSSGVGFYRGSTVSRKICTKEKDIQSRRSHRWCIYAHHVLVHIRLVGLEDFLGARCGQCFRELLATSFGDRAGVH